MSMTQITHEWAKTAMELALDCGVDSLRVGSYERKDTLMNNHGYTCETIQLRKKREKSREALTRHLFSAVIADPKDKPDTVAATNGLKINLEVLCDKLATARVALADAEANMKLLRDLFVNENSGEPN